MQKVKKETIAKHLGWAIQHKVGKRELDMLIYGWLKYRKYGNAYYEAVRHRDWLYITEVQDLSLYAGYDLTEMEL